jgi:TP901 family phage tail tape measure protein
MGGISGGGLSLGTLSVSIVAAVDQALGEFQKLGKAVDDQSSKWDGLKKTGENLSTVGTSLSVGLTAPIVGIGGAAIKAASDFESSLNKITAVGDITGKDLEQLRAQAMKLGADTKYSAQEAAEGMGNLAAAGFDTTKIMGAMPGVLDLAAAGELSVARAAEVTTDTLSQFGLSADKAGHVADVFAKGAAASSISVQQMSESMKYAGPIAQSAGISLEAVATATALLGNAGIKGEQAGTSLRGIVSSLISPSNAAAAAMEALGVKATDSAGKLMPLDQIFGQLKDKGATTADMFTIFGQNAASAAAALTNNAGPAWASMTKEIDNSDGAAKKMSETLNSGLAGGFEQMKGSLDTVLIALGTSLLPIMTNLVKVGTDFINNWILPAVEWFSKLPGPVQNVAIALAAVAAAIGPVLLVAGTMISSFATVAPIVATMVTAIGGFVAAIGIVPIAIAAVTAALVALGVWVYNNWDKITASLTAAWDSIKAKWEAVWTGIVGAVTAVWAGFKAAVAPYWNFIAELVGAIWHIVIAAWETEWKLIVAAVTIVWDAIEPYVTKVFKPIIKFLADVWDDLESGWDRIWGSIKKAVTGAWDAIDKAATAVFKPAAKFLTGIWDDAKKLWVDTWNWVKGQILGIWQTIETAVSKFTGALGAIGTVITGIPAKLNTVADSIKKVGTEADKAAGHSPVPELAAALADVFAKAGVLPKPLDDVAASAKGVGTDAAGAVPHVDGLKASLLAWGTQALSSFGGIGTAVSGALGAITGMETSAPASLATTLAGIHGKLDDPSTGVAAMKKPFETLAAGVTGLMTTFATDITKSLFEGDTSWGEKGKALLSSLGNLAKTAFVQPFEKAIGDLITGALSDLLSGKGLGGVLDTIKDIGREATSAFDKISGGAPSVPGAPGTPSVPGGGGGGGGGAASTVTSSLTGWISAISGAVTAISSVIGNFQMAGMNKSLDIIVKHTLQAANDLFNLRRDDWDRHNEYAKWKDDIVGSLWATQAHTNDAKNSLADIAPDIDAARNILSEMIGVHREATGAQQTAMDRIVSLLGDAVAGLDKLAAGQVMQMNLYGTDPTTVASKIAGRMRMQGAQA